VLSTVSEKGQITVPKRLRERLGLHPGDRLELVEDAGRLIATKAPPGGEDPVDVAYGILRSEARTDDAIRALRGEPDAV
jgi:antitoxin PrlF